MEVSDSEEEIGVQRQPPLILLIRHQQLKRFKGTVSSYSQYFHIRMSDASGTHSAIGADGLKVWADETTMTALSQHRNQPLLMETLVGMQRCLFECRTLFLNGRGDVEVAVVLPMCS